jgi:hypothetical protein
MGVPAGDNIEIHWGNYPANTEGCVMAGSSRDTDFIGNSVNTWNQLMSRIGYPANIDPLTILSVISLF